MKVQAFFLAALLSLGLQYAAPANAEIAASAEQVKPLLIGSSLPKATLRGIDGAPIKISQLSAGKASVLVFYRGGWCPYCNTQLSDLRKLVQPLKERGVNLVAISPDQPAELFKSVEKNSLDYQLYSDTSAQAIEGFGIGFKLDDATVQKYAGYGIDLEKSTGQTHHILPVPSVFLIDTNGIVQFSYVNPNYRVRVSAAVVLAAVDDLMRRTKNEKTPE